jgi:hypothetical protein
MSRNSEFVAAKVVKAPSQKVLSALTQEAAITRRLKHRNVVRFIDLFGGLEIFGALSPLFSASAELPTRQ